jgi:hypothetical protein
VNKRRFGELERASYRKGPFKARQKGLWLLKGPLAKKPEFGFKATPKALGLKNGARFLPVSSQNNVRRGAFASQAIISSDITLAQQNDDPETIGLGSSFMLSYLIRLKV